MHNCNTERLLTYEKKQFPQAPENRSPVQHIQNNERRLLQLLLLSSLSQEDLHFQGEMPEQRISGWLNLNLYKCAPVWFSTLPQYILRSNISLFVSKCELFLALNGQTHVVQVAQVGWEYFLGKTYQPYWNRATNMNITNRFCDITRENMMLHKKQNKRRIIYFHRQRGVAACLRKFSVPMGS